MNVEVFFQAAAARFAELAPTASDKDKLTMYALYNQAVNGDVDLKTEPSRMDMVKYYKFQARKKVRGMNKEQAQKKYVMELRRIDPAFVFPGESAGATSATAAANAEQQEEAEDEDETLVGTRTSQIAAGGNKAEIDRVKPTFDKAVEFARTSGLFRSDATRSMLYAYYKQAVVGPCRRAAPSFLAGRKVYARWRCWANLFDMRPEEAMKKYIELVRKLAPEFESKDPSYFATGTGAAAAGGGGGGGNAPLAKPVSRPSVIARNNAVKRAGSESEVISLLNSLDADTTRIYLVTGGTGFIGKHLIREILATRAAKGEEVLVVCVVRTPSKLITVFPQNPNVVPVTGDIAKPNLGLSEGLVKALKGKVSHFFALAAVYDVNATKEENETVNVQGTRNVVGLVNNHLLPRAHFHYVSSIAVAGDFEGVFTEEMFDEKQHFDHDYLRTKYMGEEIVRKEFKGKRYHLFRPGLVLGSSATGEAEKIDGPYYLFKPLQRLSRVIPNIITLPMIQGEQVPIVPVDYVVKAMCWIAHLAPGIGEKFDGKAFHLVDPSPPLFVEMLNIFAKAANAPSFSSKVMEMALSFIPRKAVSAIEDIPLIASAPQAVAAHILGVDDVVMRYVNSLTTFDDSNTQEALIGSGISCPPLVSYGWKLWDYYARHLDPAVDRFGSLRAEVKDKICVVTGSSDGIGETLAYRLGEAGARVVLVARSKDKLEVVAKNIASKGGVAYVHPADLADKDSTNKVVNDILKTYGKVDFLINNAGRSIRRSVEYQYDPERFHDFTRTMDLNAYGSLRLILAFLPGMRKRKTGQIISVSSIGCMTGPPRFGAYVASKAYMDAFTRCVSSECAKDNVVFSTCYIPLTKTKMVVSKENKYDHVKLFTPEQSAGLIERAIVTKERKIMTPTAWWVSIFYFLFPSLVEAILNLMYKLEPEAPPNGMAASPEATGDKEQLKKLGSLFSGAL